MNLIQTTMAGCFEIQPRIFEDSRGRFIKPFQQSWMLEHGLEGGFSEDFYSVSAKGVLRGLHFQEPPHDQAKLVYCTRGAAFDVAVDLRRHSKTYGRFQAFELTAAKGNSLYLPKGFAHGFYALEDGTTIVYKVSAEYSPAHDKGVLWSSLGIPWPNPSPVVSVRDAAFPKLADYVSPF